MPYTPTVQDRTGEFLMRGISGAADSLAQGIREWKKNKEESGGFDTLIEGAVRADPTLAEKYGDQLAKAPGMSLSQKKSLAGTLALESNNKRLAKEQQMKEQDYNLRKSYFDLQQGQLSRANQRDAAGQRFTETLAGLMGGGGEPSMDFANTLAGEPMPARDLGLADIVQAAGRSGLALDPERLAPLMRADNLDRRAGLAAPMPPKIVKLADGTDVVWGEQTGKWDFLPKSVDKGTVPAKDQIGAIKAEIAALTKNPPLTMKDRTAWEAKLQAAIDKLGRFTGEAAPAPTAAGAVVGGDLSFDDFKSGSWKRQ